MILTQIKEQETFNEVAIIPLNEVVMLTTEREKRAGKLGVDKDTIPMKYATFFSVCKAISVDGQWAYVEHSEQEMNTYARIWGIPITRIRVVIETIFTFKDSMPTSIQKWEDAIPYVEDGENALRILDETWLYTIVPTLWRPYVDRDPSHRTRINTNIRRETILSHHIKQWASNWGPVLGYLDDSSHYASSISAIDTAEFITKGILPTTSPRSYTRHDTFARSMVFTR